MIPFNLINERILIIQLKVYGCFDIPEHESNCKSLVMKLEVGYYSINSHHKKSWKQSNYLLPTFLDPTSIAGY
jgi:hypothetical protein